LGTARRPGKRRWRASYSGCGGPRGSETRSSFPTRSPKHTKGLRVLPLEPVSLIACTFPTRLLPPTAAQVLHSSSGCTRARFLQALRLRVLRRSTALVFEPARPNLARHQLRQLASPLRCPCAPASQVTATTLVEMSRVRQRVTSYRRVRWTVARTPAAEHVLLATPAFRARFVPTL
jgi:hypothetical protein